MASKPWESEWEIDGDKGKPFKSSGQADLFIVFRINDPEKQKYVLKVFKKPKPANREERRGRMKGEANALIKLWHPLISSLVSHNTDTDDEMLFLVTKFIDGVTLEDLVRNHGGNLTFQQSFYLMFELLNTLEYCHSSGVIHRDIKPDNVMLNSDSRPVLIDFGLSFDGANPEDALTAKSLELGNRFFALPELIVHSSNVDDKRDARSDITVLLGLLLFMLTGEYPTAPLDRENKLPHLRADVWSKLSQVVPESKLEFLSAIFSKGLQPDINSRFQEIRELSIALHFCLYDDIPNFNFSKSITTALGLSTDATLIPSFQRSLPDPNRSHPQQSIWYFSFDLLIHNKESSQVRDYHLNISFPKALLPGRPPGVIITDRCTNTHQYFEVPGKDIRWEIKPGFTSAVTTIQCLVGPEQLSKRKEINALIVEVEVFRTDELQHKYTFPVKELNPFAIMDS